MPVPPPLPAVLERPSATAVASLSESRVPARLVYGVLGDIEAVEGDAAVGRCHVLISGEMDGLVENDVGSISQEPWPGAQAQIWDVEV